LIVELRAAVDHCDSPTPTPVVASRYRPIPGVTVLGISGKSRHGKDSLAQEIIKLRPGAERFGFSDAISVYARVSGEMSERDPVVLQRVGWAMRQTKPTVWLDALYGTISDRRPALALVTGVRFKDEVELIRAMGGTLVRIVRILPDRSEYVSPDRPADHPVEQQIDGLYCEREIVINDRNLAMIANAAAWLLADLDRQETAE
jgi:hypothetical protein